MKLNTLAFRNIFRRKRRTLITAFSIAFGVMLSVTFTGSGDYTYTNMIDTGATMGMGHVTIQPLHYHEKPTLDKRLAHMQQNIQQLLQQENIQAAVPRIMGQAMFASANKSVGGAFIAIDPVLESNENNLFLRSMVEGKLFDSNSKRGVMIGSKLAKNLKLKVGKKMVYTTTDVYGEIVGNITRVSGIFTTGVNMVDSALVLLPLKSTQYALGYTPDEVTLIAVTIEDQRKARDVRADLAALPINKANAVLSWHDSQPDLAGVIAMDSGINYIMQILIGLLIAAGILNTMLMGVLERKHEFGMMVAVGMSPNMLFRLVMVECFWLALLGLVMGIIITAPWYYYLYHTGIDLTGSVGGEFNYGGVIVDPVFKARLFPESVYAILGTVFTLAMLAGAYPAWRAGHTPPVESLKAI
ncbi:MAG: FtsX-like permease family protein [Mariprofundales bacterium]